MGKQTPQAPQKRLAADIEQAARTLVEAKTVIQESEGAWIEQGDEGGYARLNTTESLLEYWHQSNGMNKLADRFHIVASEHEKDAKYLDGLYADTLTACCKYDQASIDCFMRGEESFATTEKEEAINQVDRLVNVLLLVGEKVGISEPPTASVTPPFPAIDDAPSLSSTPTDAEWQAWVLVKHMAHLSYTQKKTAQELAKQKAKGKSGKPVKWTQGMVSDAIQAVERYRTTIPPFQWAKVEAAQKHRFYSTDTHTMGAMTPARPDENEDE